MKNITDFINESSINEGMFNSNVPRDIVKWIMGYGGKITPHQSAKVKAQEIVDNLNKNLIGDYANYKVMTAEEYTGSNSNIDDGGIIIISDKGEEVFIDLKAASRHSEKGTAGPIPIGSLLAFGKGSKNHYYLCTSNDGKSKAIINANDLYNAWVKDPILIAGEKREQPISGVKATVRFPSDYSGDKSDDTVYYEDYISHKWLGTHDFLNSYFKWN
jgi:hypothetical protein